MGLSLEPSLDFGVSGFHQTVSFLGVTSSAKSEGSPVGLRVQSLVEVHFTVSATTLLSSEDLLDFLDGVLDGALCFTSYLLDGVACFL